LVKINGAVPDRGDIIKLQFNPQFGREQANYRPAIVVSPADYSGFHTYEVQLAT
jgi:mRNA interferase MazF